MCVFVPTNLCRASTLLVCRQSTRFNIYCAYENLLKINWKERNSNFHWKKKKKTNHFDFYAYETPFISWTHTYITAFYDSGCCLCHCGVAVHASYHQIHIYTFSLTIQIRLLLNIWITCIAEALRDKKKERQHLDVNIVTFKSHIGILCESFGKAFINIYFTKRQFCLKQQCNF